jgi:hypothetical protein
MGGELSNAHVQYHRGSSDKHSSKIDDSRSRDVARVFGRGFRVRKKGAGTDAPLDIVGILVRVAGLESGFEVLGALLIVAV